MERSDRLNTVKINESINSVKKQVEKAIYRENGTDPAKMTKIFSLKI